MTFPGNFSRVWVRGRFVDLAKMAAGAENYGTITAARFRPSPGVLLDAATRQIISTGTFTATPAEGDGYFAILLPATDDPDINPTGWTYGVTDPAGRTYNIVVPIDTPALNSPGDPLHGEQVIDLIDLAPGGAANPGTVQLVTGAQGEQGRSVTGVVVDGAGHLQLTLSDYLGSETVDAGYVVGPQGVQGVKGDTGATGDTGPKGDPGDLTQAAADGRYVAKSGSTMTGNLNVPGYDGVNVAGSLTNKTYIAVNGVIAQTPFAGIWHDRLAFNKGFGPPTYETTADGTTWATGAAMSMIPFAMKEDVTTTPVDGVSTQGARWTWANGDVGFSAVRWLVIGWAYVSPAGNRTVTVETSADGGVTWTVRHTSTTSNVGTPMWHSVSDWAGDTRVRLTIVWNSGGAVRVTAIRMLTARWGDQGGGREYEFPYEWDGDGRVGIGGGVDAAVALKVHGSVGVEGRIWGLTDPVSDDHAATKRYVDTGLAAKANTASPTFTGTPTAPSLETTTAAAGVIVRSPNGTRYRIGVSDAGAIVVAPA